MYTTGEAADELGITANGVLRHIERGNIKAERVRSGWLISAEELEDYKKRRRPAHRPKSK